MLKPLILLIALSMATGCGIAKDQHAAVLSDLEATKIALADSERAREESEADLQGQISALNARIVDGEKREAALSAELNEAKDSLSVFETKTGSLEESLQATKSELAELRKAREQAEKRLKVYRDLASKLASMVESGQLAVKIRDGKMVIELADNILFDPGRTDIKPAGQDALKQLAGVLADIKERNFLVAGHTDNVPISSARFKSNWELSTARAVEVVKFLEQAGVGPSHLAAAGYGEHDPVSSNETKESRSLNRRIEIILMPNIEELPNLSEKLLDGA